MEHLLNSCTFTSRLWDTFATIFQKTDREKESIISTLSSWRRNFSDNEVLNSAWALMPSFKYGMFGRKGTRESSKMKRITLFACLNRS